jgi:hypothetical protein
MCLKGLGLGARKRECKIMGSCYFQMRSLSRMSVFKGDEATGLREKCR